jgi:hypothetical protein
MIRLFTLSYNFRAEKPFSDLPIFSYPTNHEGKPIMLETETIEAMMEEIAKLENELEPTLEEESLYIFEDGPYSPLLIAATDYFGNWIRIKQNDEGNWLRIKQNDEGNWIRIKQNDE